MKVVLSTSVEPCIAHEFPVRSVLYQVPNVMFHDIVSRTGLKIAHMLQGIILQGTDRGSSIFRIKYETSFGSLCGQTVKVP